MDYAHNSPFMELKPKFKGVITRLLSELLYEEDFLEPVPDNGPPADKAQKEQLLRQYAKPFT